MFQKNETYQKSHRKSYQKNEIYRKMSKMSKLYQNFQHLTVYVKNNCWTVYKMAQIWPIFGPNLTKLVKNDSENGQNSQKLYPNFLLLTKNGNFIPKRANFQPFSKCQKCYMLPNYSNFYFCKRPYNFAKMYRTSKLLPECMALAHTSKHKFNLLICNICLMQ